MYLCSSYHQHINYMTKETRTDVQIYSAIAMLVAGVGLATAGFIDFVVLASGVVEIALGLGMLLLWKKKAVVGALLALFYVAIFPGNINQYVNHIDAFGLNTDNLRLIRLFIQPVLIFLALWSTGGWQQLKEWWQYLTKSKKT